MKNITIRPKTPRAPFNVFYKGVEEPLGVIQYHKVTESTWDKPQYGFVPTNNSGEDLVMGSACLKEISEILENLNKED